MKKLMGLMSIFLILSFYGSASATPYTDIDTTVVTFSDEGNSNRSYTWDFDLANDFLTVGNIDDNDLIDTAYLYWTISGDDIADKRKDSLREYIDVYVNGTKYLNDWEMDNNTFNFVDQYNNNYNWADGTSGLVIQFMMNDFDDSSKKLNDDIQVSNVMVTGQYTEVANNPVPEPATMMLFGLGLLGLAGVSRKKS